MHGDEQSATDTGTSEPQMTSFPSATDGQRKGISLEEYDRLTAHLQAEPAQDEAEEDEAAAEVEDVARIGAFHLADPAPHSSIFDKIEPELRRKLDLALAERHPPTYRAVYGQFELYDKGVSFSALARYGRRVRARAAMRELTNLEVESPAEVSERLVSLLRLRTIEALLDDETGDAKVIAKLAFALTGLSTVKLGEQRLASTRELAGKKLEQQVQLAKAPDPDVDRVTELLREIQSQRANLAWERTRFAEEKTERS